LVDIVGAGVFVSSIINDGVDEGSLSLLVSMEII
jgi:hypothetical protein